ncbi:MAG: AAA family ATPase [Xanthobacteraceae bacterium]|nr:AAA family ATPase [Xanthobacteraceae bacterium]
MVDAPSSAKTWLSPVQSNVWAIRKQLWAAGYRPLAVYGAGEKVPSPGKQPVGKGWQERARLDPPEAVTVAPAMTGLNTGILCDGLRAVDIDIDDERHAQEICAQAWSILGEAPVRFRAGSARRLMLYRAIEGEPRKRAVNVHGGKVEVLGFGQQFVGFGDHVDGSAYDWQPANFHERGRSALTAVSEEQVQRFLQAIVPMAAADGTGNAAIATAVTDHERAYAMKALQDNFSELRAKTEGSGRNDALNGIAYRMGRMVGSGWIAAETVKMALVEASHLNGYAAKDTLAAVEATIASGLTRGIQNPHPPLVDAPVLDTIRRFAEDGRVRFTAGSPVSNPVMPIAMEDRLIVHRVSDVQPEPIEWLWGQRIAIGKLSLIAGDPGLGKSQLTAFMAARVTTGTAWPDDNAPRPTGSVVMLSCEDDVGDTIRPRLEAAGANLDRVHVVEAVRTGIGAMRGLSLQTDMTRLERLLDELPDVRLVIIDPITAYLDKTDTHKTADVRAALAPAQALAARRRIAIVAVSHLNKSSGNGKSVNAITGSGAFVAASRATFLVTKGQEDEGLRLFVQAKNNLGQASGLAYRVQLKELPNNIVAPYIEFEKGTVAITADEAIGEGEHRSDHSQLDAAKHFLTEELRHGAVSSKTCLPMRRNRTFRTRPCDAPRMQWASKRAKTASRANGFGNSPSPAALGRAFKRLLARPRWP